MKKSIFGCIKVIFFLIIVSLFFTPTVTAITNPAPTYCTEMSYIVDGDYCVFPDNETCKLSDFFSGICGQEYIKELSCIESGGSIKPGHECCRGLYPIGVSNPGGPEGACVIKVGVLSICAPCGDGVCEEELENICNCPKDCEEICKTEGQSYSIFEDPQARCCEGLDTKSIYDLENCIAVPGGKYSCVKCGNGICGPGENKCNCPKDCSNTTNSEYKDYESTDGEYTQDSENLVSGQEIDTETIISVENNGRTRKVRINLHEDVPGSKGVFATIETDKISVGYSGDLFVEETVLYMETSVGRKRMNILPEGAISVSETPDISSVMKVELKEETQRPVYSVRGKKNARILFIIPVTVKIETKVDAETGEIVSIKKPWWNILAW